MAHVLKIAVDARKTHLRHLIDLRKPLHDELPDNSGRDLPVIFFADRGLEIIRDLFLGRERHGAFLARLVHSGVDFGTLIRLTTLVLFHHKHRDLINPLISGEPLIARRALAPAADHFPFVRHP